MSSIWASLAVAKLDLKPVVGRPGAALSLVVTTCMGFLIITLVLAGNGDGFRERLAYIFPGLLALQCLSSLSGVANQISLDRGNGTFIAMMLSPSNRDALLVGHLIGAIGKMMFQALVLSAMGIAICGTDAAFDFCSGGIAIWALCQGVVLFGCLGFVLATLFRGLSHLALMIAVSFGAIASTAYFTPEAIPSGLRIIARANPITHICDMLRCGLDGTLNSHFWYAVIFLMAQSILVAGFAIALARRADRFPVSVQ